MPWTNPAARRAGTVHLGGHLRRTRRHRAGHPRRAHAGAAVRAGRAAVSGRPAALGRRHPPACGPTRTCPNGYTGDATAAIVAQIERFAPGFRDRVVGQTVRTTTQIGRIQPQLRRRRHHDRRQGHSPVGIRPANHAVAVPYWRTGYVHLLGRHATRPRRTRYVRRQRRTSRTQRPGHSRASVITWRPPDVSIRITPRSQAWSARRGQAAVDGRSPRPRRQASRT